MKKLTGSEIRRLYLDFFASKGHSIQPSQSLIPVDDPTLLWINSGVATLKKYFDGRVVPENRRIVNSQKSIRTNDIENVGKTARHHTFFEMLGNFSIGDYFKKEAIAFAWEFLTSPDYLGFDKNVLFVTIYPDDTEAFDLWVNEGLDPSHIVKLEDNFWEIGEGPSGPNTEIFVDRGEAYNYDTPKEELYPGGENERYLEIWNLVFSQFNAKEGIPRSEYPELPSKNIDTGMGLERITSVIQNTKTNYETDLIFPIIEKVEAISGKKYFENDAQDVAFRVIADHIRTAVFAISDGAMPSNEGRGYIIRRLIRRSVKFARTLGMQKPFLSELVDTVLEIFKDYYPENIKNRDFIKTILEKEEVRFHETLAGGLSILNSVIASSSSKVIDGETAFKLYDTYGFPIELTIEYAEEAGYTVDVHGFKHALKQQQDRAREAREDDGSMHTQNKTLLELKEPSSFIGYNTLKIEGQIKVILKGEGLLSVAKQGDEIQIITDQTPFYAVSGGQVADYGFMYNQKGRVEVLDVTKAPNKQNLHYCRVVEGEINVNDRVTLEVDVKKRALTTRNHTATHLLHKALGIVLGEHVSQAGSYVGPDYLRFDFKHYEAVSKEDLAQVEAIVNAHVFYSEEVSWTEMPIDEAKALGAKALFSEKYGDVVRVVKAGDFSIELCGGCHVANTSEIGVFKIVSESGIGSGIRRIEAVTSEAAVNYLQAHVAKVETIASLVKGNSQDVVEKVQVLQQDLKASQKEVEILSQKLANVKLKDLVREAKTVNGIQVLAAKVKDIQQASLRNMLDQFKDQLGSALIVLANVESDKVTFMVGATEDLVKKGVHSGKLIKEIAQMCGGNGGGRPDFAQAGGKEPQNVDQALAFVTNYIQSL